MQKLFSHQFSQNIWRVMPDSDPESDLWAIELRDIPPAKKVSFALIDLESSELKWQKEPEATDWWTSLTAFSYGHVYLHNYRYPDLPQPTDLLMVSGRTGNLQWVMPNYLFVKTINSAEIEVATRVGDEFKYFHCNSETGILSSKPENGKQPDGQIILKQAVRYKEGNIYFDKLASFIFESTFGHQPVCIDYLENRPYMMFSYYIYTQENLVEYLLIVSDKREHIFHEQLSKGRDGIGQSTMMLKGAKLVFLKNNNEFSGLTFP